MNVQARFKVSEIKQIDTGQPCAIFTFQAVYGDGKGNESWSKATPNGKLEMTITNPAAIAAFVIGKTYELTFAPVE